TNEARGVSFSGRILYKKPFKLQSKKKASVGSFITKFALRITPQTDPGGEGLALILTKDLYYIPPNSFGPCLGIVSSVTDDPNRKEIIAVEFDTKKSYDEDLDDNHVGHFGIELSSGKEITTMTKYDGSTKEFNVSVSSNDTMMNKARKEQDEGSFGLKAKELPIQGTQSATSNFDARYELGRGGFGIVYKENLEGEEVTVKRISKNSKEGRKNMIA
ncbi:hypothetical protein V2J09_013768, partial [Rumex salicifolius]